MKYSPTKMSKALTKVRKNYESLVDMAEVFGISHPTLTGMMNPKTKSFPRMQVFCKVMTALEKKPGAFFE